MHVYMYMYVYICFANTCTHLILVCIQKNILCSLDLCDNC